ncbi:hypothetical protein J2T12_001006 [Paenibacillus anaericanus]|uniref:hypothetical protein n=1 Tax=Paenibacillus anaericanus TaxID=170367 RepID=UPI002782A1CE|nr:hypothetical protein [Paenibacillus anaericanus]MDQ0087612.1 hypothetical protein [Paenibacillus anaericanus]
MKKKIDFLRSFVFIFLVVIVATALLSIWTYNKFGLTESIYSGVISGIGSFLGGLAGGIVAFGIARSQFQNEKEKELQQQQSKYFNILRALMTEIKNNKKILSNYNATKKEEYLYLIESDIWRQIRFDANNMLPTETFDIIDESYREMKDMINKSIGYETHLSNLDLRIKVLDKLEKELDRYIKKS